MMTTRYCVLATFFLAIQAPSSVADSAVLSAGYGATILPPIANFAFCPGFGQSAGFGGMPVAFNEPLDTLGGFLGDFNAIDPGLFRVRIGVGGELVTPICATLAPAVDPGERRTLLLTGEFGLGGDDGPTGIRVVGDVFTVGGENLRGTTFKDVAEVNAGPSLVLAEQFEPAGGVIRLSAPDDGTNDRFCPEDTESVVKLTFSGGVTGADGAVLQDDAIAMDAITIMGVWPDGTRTAFHPVGLRDDDNDNHLDACLDAQAQGLELQRVTVDSHTFYAPQNVPGQARTVLIRQY